MLIKPPEPVPTSPVDMDTGPAPEEGLSPDRITMGPERVEPVATSPVARDKVPLFSAPVGPVLVPPVEI